MTETTDRFVIEIGSGTVAHIVDMDASTSENDDRFSLGPSAPGEKMCSRSRRYPRSQRVPFSEFLAQNEIDEDGFEGDAPDEICSYSSSSSASRSLGGS
jgi:hypothetical protein